MTGGGSPSILRRMRFVRGVAPLLLLASSFVTPAARADDDAKKDDCWDCNDKDREKEKEKKQHESPWLEKNCVWGLRGSGMDLRGSDADEGTGGASLFTWSDKYATRGIFTYRGSILGMLGGGTAGFEGGLGGGLQWGVRAKVDEYHGPLMRIGFDGLMIGNEKLFASYIEVPTTHVGYQYLKGVTVLEVGGHGGAILDGRFNTGDDARRKLGGFDFGAYMAVHLPDARFDVSWMRVVAKRSDPKTPVDMLRGAACVYVDIFGACVDAWYMRGDVQYHMPIQTSTSQVLYGGLLIGLREGLP